MDIKRGQLVTLIFESREFEAIVIDQKARRKPLALDMGISRRRL